MIGKMQFGESLNLELSAVFWLWRIVRTVASEMPREKAWSRNRSVWSSQLAEEKAFVRVWGGTWCPGSEHSPGGVVGSGVSGKV